MHSFVSSVCLTLDVGERFAAFPPAAEFAVKCGGQLTAGFSVTTSLACDGELSADRAITGLTWRTRDFGESLFSKALCRCRRTARKQKERHRACTSNARFMPLEALWPFQWHGGRQSVICS
jgi:hypothetical protein